MSKATLLASVFLAAAFVASPAQAVETRTDWLDPQVYLDKDALSRKVTVREPNMRAKNFFGALFERKLTPTRGRVAAAGIAAGITGTMGYSLSTDAKAVESFLTGAAAGFASGCIAGGIAGALPGVLSGGTTILGGCLAFGLQGALLGGFAGVAGSELPLDEGGTINVPVPTSANDPVGIFGTGVVGENVANLPPLTTSYHVDCAVSSNGGYVSCNPPSSHPSIAGIFSNVGLNRTFACSSSNPAHTSFGLRACIFVPAFARQRNVGGWSNYGWSVTGGGGFSNEDPVGDMVAMPRFLRVGSISSPLCAGNGCWYGTGTFTSRGEYNVQGNIRVQPAVMLLVGPVSYPAIQDVPAQHVETLPKRPVWAEILGGKLDAQTEQLKLSNKALAAMSNHMLAQKGLLSAETAITEDDVQQLKIARPDLAPRIGDLVRPVDHPSREEQSASESEPARPALPVTVIGGNSGTGMSDMELKLTGDLGPDLPTLPGVDVGSFTYDPGQCPTFNLGVSISDPEVARQAAGIGIVADRPVDFMCGPLNEHAGWLRPLFLLFIGLHAFVIFRN